MPATTTIEIDVTPSTLLAVTIEEAIEEEDTPVGIANVCIDGTPQTFMGTFVNNESDPPSPANPDRCGFSFAVDGGEPTVYIFGTDPEITNPVEGTFKVTVDTTGMAPAGDKAYLVGQYTGAPHEESESTVQAQESATVFVLAPKVANPFG